MSAGVSRGSLRPMIRFPRCSPLPIPDLPAALLLCLRLGGAGWLPLAQAADWPQFLGPQRDGSTSESLDTHWPADGPRVLWSRDVGSGFSGPVVVGNRVLLHQRRGAQEVLECYDADRGGAPSWQAATPTGYRDDFGFDDGPRATPAVADGRVFTFGAEGTLSCFELESGRRSWSVSTVKELGAEKGFFGFACSPLVAGDRVIVNVGGAGGAGVVAFDTKTGKVRWKATDHEAGYAAPVLVKLGGLDRVVAFTRSGLAVLDPANGEVLVQRPWRSRQHASVNAATPLALGADRLLLTASYGTGAAVFEIRGREAGVVWSNDDSLSSHYASVVLRDGLLYGFHGRQEQGPSLRCVEAATGRVRWSKEGLGAGTILRAGENLVVLTERGELLVGPASGDGFVPAARAQVLGTGTRAYPAIAAGRLVARDPRRLACLDLRPAR